MKGTGGVEGAGGVEGTDGVALDHVELLRLEVSAACSCGETLDRGEQAGFDVSRRELLCLWCLADLKDGRARPKHRDSRPGVPVVTPSPGPAAYLPADTLPTAHHPTAHHPTAHQPTAHHPTAYLPTTSAPRPGRRRGRPDAVTTGLMAFLVVCLALLARPYLFPAGSEASAADGATSGSRLRDIAMGSPITPAAPSGSSSMWPPVPADARPAPLGTPPGQKSSSTAYEFMTTTPSGMPVAFDPCRPVRLVVNDAQAPPGADALLREAVTAVGEATGLTLLVEGTTSEPPVSSRPSKDEARYGNRWSPVLVAWTDEESVPGLAGRIAGLGGPVMAPYRQAGDMHFVSGIVYLDGPTFADLRRRLGGREQARAIVMHELAHLIGLTHVDDPGELMYAENLGQTRFGAGDLEGLRRLGSGPCFSK